MARNIKAQAIVLKINPVGENHRGIAMLVSGEGLLRPLAFGAQGRRSGLRATAVPFNQGIADLHYDGSKDSWRLTSFDPVDVHEGLGEDLDRFYAAASWAEILLNTHGGGNESEQVFSLASEAFSLMATAKGEEILRLRVSFLWAFLNIEGVRPDPMHCGRCSRLISIGEADTVRFLANGLLHCHSCSQGRGSVIPDGGRRWLATVSDISLGESMRIGLPRSALTAAESWLLTIVQSLLEKPLRSLRL